MTTRKTSFVQKKNFFHVYHKHTICESAYIYLQIFFAPKEHHLTYSTMLFKILIAVAYLFNNANAAYVQLSSTVTQPNGPLGTGTALTYNSIDAGPVNITYTSGSSKITVSKDGAYFIIAAPQVGYSGSGVGFFGRLFGNVATYTADYYVVVNGDAVANSNVRLNAVSTHKDVIVTQGVYILKGGDVIEIFGAGTDSFSEYITQTGEPDIPSIIATVFSV